MSDAPSEMMVVDSLQGLSYATPVGRPAPIVAPVFTEESVIARLRDWEKAFVYAQAPATVRGVRTDWAQYIAWCQQHKLSPLPASVEQLAAFLRNLITRGRKRSTVNRYLYSVCLIHENAGLGKPTDDPAWRLTWSGLVKKDLRVRGNNLTEQAAELRQEDVETILAHLASGKATRWTRRDAALIALASDTMLRESELVMVCVEHFDTTRRNGARLRVPFSKTNRSGAELDYRHVTAETMALVDALRAAEGISSGVLFRAFGGRPRRAEGRIEQAGSALPGGLGPQEVARIFRQRALDAGVPQAARVSGHSTRVGTANDLIEAGYSTPQIMEAGKWKSPQMVALYTRRSGAGENAVADLRAKRRGAREK